MRLRLRLWQRWRQWLTDWLTAQQVKRKSKKGANFRQWLAGEQSVVANRNGSFGFWLVWQAVVSNKFLKNRAWQGGKRSLALCRAQKSLNLQWTTKVLGLWCLSLLPGGFGQPDCTYIRYIHTYITRSYVCRLILWYTSYWFAASKGIQTQRRRRRRRRRWLRTMPSSMQRATESAGWRANSTELSQTESKLPCGRFISSYPSVPNDVAYTLYTHGNVYDLHYFLALSIFIP